MRIRELFARNRELIQESSANPNDVAPAAKWGGAGHRIKEAPVTIRARFPGKQCAESPVDWPRRKAGPSSWGLVR
jgi:hypothetical protein